MKSDESEESNAFCWCSILTTPLQIETCNFSTEGKFAEFNMRLMGNLGNSSFYSNCMLFLVGNVIFFPLIVSRKRPAVLNFSYGRGWGGGLRGAQGTLLPVFSGGRVSIHNHSGCHSYKRNRRRKSGYLFIKVSLPHSLHV